MSAMEPRVSVAGEIDALIEVLGLNPRETISVELRIESGMVFVDWSGSRALIDPEERTRVVRALRESMRPPTPTTEPSPADDSTS